MRARQWSSTSPRARKASRPLTSSAYKTSAPRESRSRWRHLLTASEFGQTTEPSRKGGFLLPLQALQSPARVLGNNRVFVATEFFQHRQEALVAAVAHCDCHVAAKSVESCALYRRAAKQLAKFIHAELRQPFELRIDQLRPRFQFRRLRQPRLAVPRANILADVAAENLASDANAQFFRD